MKLTYKKDHNLVQLMNELIEQNAINTATDFVESKANEIYITIKDETKRNLVNSVVEKHVIKEYVKKPTQQDILNAKLIADNAELLKVNEEQKKLNAELLLKIAMLGGKANV